MPKVKDRADKHPTILLTLSDRNNETLFVIPWKSLFPTTEAPAVSRCINLEREFLPELFAMKAQFMSSYKDSPLYPLLSVCSELHATGMYNDSRDLVKPAVRRLGGTLLPSAGKKGVCGRICAFITLDATAL